MPTVSYSQRDGRARIAPVAIAVAADAVVMMSAIGSAMAGMAGAITRFDRASASIARPDSPGLIGDRVEQIAAQRTFEANLATVRTADEMIGAVIDIVA